MNKPVNLVSYLGGKYPLLRWLLPLFPRGNYHFVDLMCGSATVALNVNYPLITVNDINDEIINLFNVLRNQQAEFMQAIYFTPFAKSEVVNIIRDNIAGKKFDPVERARRYYTLCQQGYGANGSQNNHMGFGIEYHTQKTDYYRVDSWNYRLKKLPGIVDKLRHMQVQSINALDLFDKVDKPGNIIYIDPPYLLSTRNGAKRYRHEVDLDFHLQLMKKALKSKAFVAISGFDSELYSENLSGFHKTLNKPTRLNVGKRLVQECLWTNYDPSAINGQQKIKF